MKRKRRNTLKLLTGFLIISTGACSLFKGEDKMNQIFADGEIGPAEYFTNTARVKMLETDPDKLYDTQVYNVVFEPSARTFWHSHPGGQILLITDGSGYYQEKGKPARHLRKGDTVSIAPDIVHWHGAAPDRPFVHIGMSTQVHLGPAVWTGPVTDEEYIAATRSAEK